MQSGLAAKEWAKERSAFSLARPTDGQPSFLKRPTYLTAVKKDLACAVAIVALAAAILLPRLSALPMELWDESRNANNALEMARSGHWLVTSFAGAPDHWNTKPPLFVWIVAALMKAGVSPLWAMRLPSAAAAAATATALFTFCRWVLLDRLAGMLSALLLLSSTLFMGGHVARTGDYDALLCLFTTLTALCFACYVDGPEQRKRLFAYGTALALVLGIMTKGVAAAMLGPGLLLFVILRGRLALTLRDRDVWIGGGAVVLCCALYYGGRELADPGYLRAVWQNELGGRYLSVVERNGGDAWFYVRPLLSGFEPGSILVPLTVVPLWLGKGRARTATLLCLCVGGALLAILTGADTKLYWYAAPIVPMLSLAVGISSAETLSLLQRPRSRPPIIRAGALKAAIFAALGLGVGQCLYFAQVHLVAVAREPYYAQWWYATVLNPGRPNMQQTLVVDRGIRTTSGFTGYNPIAEFYSDYARAKQVIMPGGQIAPASWVATCDAKARQWLIATQGFVAVRANRWCVLGKTAKHGSDH